MRTSAAALALVLAAGLAGCSSDEEPPSTLPPLPSATPTAAPVPSPPAEAAAETPKGAEAFAVFYLRLIQDAYERGDTAALRAASADGCGGCESLIQSVEAVAARGERQVSGAVEIRSVAAPGFDNGDVVLLVDYSVPTKTFSDARGQVVATTPPVAMVTAQMRLVRRGPSWVVQGYRIVEA